MIRRIIAQHQHGPVEQVLVRWKMLDQPVLGKQPESHGRIAQGQAGQGVGNVGPFRGVGLEKFAPGRGIEKQVPDLHHGAGRSAGVRHLDQLAPGHLHPGGGICVMGTGHQAEPGHRSNGRQGLAAESETGNGKQVVLGENLAGGIPLDGQQCLVPGQTGAVVRHPDQRFPPVVHLHGDAGGTGIDAVFHQLLDHGCRPLHHLAGGDLVGQNIRQNPDHSGILFYKPQQELRIPGT